jgi:hypothetical protein
VVKGVFIPISIYPAASFFNSCRFKSETSSGDGRRKGFGFLDQFLRFYNRVLFVMILNSFNRIEPFRR